MPDVYTGFDRIGLYYTGGANNSDPALSLGGAISNRLIQGMGIRYIQPVAGLVVEEATPENNEGVGTINMTDTQANYVPPDGVAGPFVDIAAGERKVLLGGDTTKAVRIYREPGLNFGGIATFQLVDAFNGVFAMGNVSDADRVAGAVYYRGFFLKVHAEAREAKIWVTSTGQASWDMAVDQSANALSGNLELIPDENTAPALPFFAANSEATALYAPGVTYAGGALVGLWLRKTIPPGSTVSTEETVQIHLNHQGS